MPNPFDDAVGDARRDREAVTAEQRAKARELADLYAQRGEEWRPIRDDVIRPLLDQAGKALERAGTASSTFPISNVTINLREPDVHPPNRPEGIGLRVYAGAGRVDSRTWELTYNYDPETNEVVPAVKNVNVALEPLPFATAKREHFQKQVEAFVRAVAAIA